MRICRVTCSQFLVEQSFEIFGSFRRSCVSTPNTYVILKRSLSIISTKFQTVSVNPMAHFFEEIIFKQTLLFEPLHIQASTRSLLSPLCEVPNSLDVS